MARELHNKSKKNVIILTSGLAGSSALAELIARLGYWNGDSTIKKQDYDTWENTELVALNKKIIENARLPQDWTMVSNPSFVKSVEHKFSSMEKIPMKTFIDKCNSHAPWVWKDPRLWLTIRSWRKFIDLSNTVFLVIRRDPLQAWMSATLRRQIQTYQYLKHYDDVIYKTIEDFIAKNDANHLNILYEDLICVPNTVIGEINDAIGTQITINDFRSVFRGQLYRKQHGIKSFFAACAIYLRNYRHRYR